ncbi:MAG: diadenylate cyclase CdaA [Oscillospiraceae bacterium]|nr:diadenylate cyclase CdaA [Oscillospiraceae bacterium]
MNTFLTDLVDSAKYILSMQWYDVVDILLVAGAIYAVLTFIRRTNATKVARGILILIIALWLSSALGLTVTNFILQQVFSIGIIAVVVLFQPEIRRALERVGSNPMFSFLGRDWGSQALENVIMQTVYACEDMAKSRTGALIVFERYNRLDEQLSSGTAMDAIVSTELLKNIFFDKSPLHDGAVIVKDGRIAAAGCMLPLSKNANLSRDLGMRHRAGIGMSEHSDAVVVIVSEETGGISVAVDGLLKRHLSPDTFEMLLRRELLPADEPDKRITLRDKLRRKMEKKHGENEGDE